MSTIITGEAVVLELRPAAFGARAVGSAIDFIVSMIVLLGAIFLIAAIPSALDFAAIQAIVLGLSVLVIVVVPITVETLSRGRSLGKLIMGLRVVRDDGGAIRFRHALTRGLVAVLEIYMSMGSIAFLASIFNDKSKRIGDMMAGTYAIRTRAPKEAPLPVFVVPALQPWAKLVDIGTVPDSLARRISVFLRHNSTMTAESRNSVANALAQEASNYVAPLPQAGTPPEIFLAALLSERREREYAKLLQSQDKAASLRERIRSHGISS